MVDVEGNVPRLGTKVHKSPADRNGVKKEQVLHKLKATEYSLLSHADCLCLSLLFSSLFSDVPT